MVNSSREHCGSDNTRGDSFTGGRNLEQLSSANLNDKYIPITFLEESRSLNSLFALIARRKQLPESSGRYIATLIHLEVHK